MNLPGRRNAVRPNQCAPFLDLIHEEALEVFRRPTLGCHHPGMDEVPMRSYLRRALVAARLFFR
jgi:hypothetical protein